MFEIIVPQFDWEENPSCADWFIRKLVADLSLAAQANELQLTIAESPTRWNPGLPRCGIAHKYNDEWFFQLQGGCIFRFSPTEEVDLRAGGVLLVPRNMPHQEIIHAAEGRPFANLVLILNETVVTFHLALSANRGPYMDVRRQVTLTSPAFYQGMTSALVHAGNQEIANRLLSVLFARIGLDLDEAFRGTAHNNIHHLARRAMNLIMEEERPPLLSVAEVAERIGCSPNYLSNIFRSSYSISLKEFLLTTRLERARDMLLDGSLNASEAAEQCGFRDASYFGRVFRKRYGCTPAHLRRA
ncbi:MAG: helix-turn-helix domain-containing protein [Victivallaceae bacterium]|nr:helix-turn-helix domain-containing protein [Victivallaceae bacterium]